MKVLPAISDDGISIFHRPTKLTIQTHYASMRCTINKKLYGKKIVLLGI